MYEGDCARLWALSRLSWGVALYIALISAAQCRAAQLEYEPFTIGPGAYHLGPLVGQPSDIVTEPQPFFSGSWVGSNPGPIIQAGVIAYPGVASGGSVAGARPEGGRAARYLAAPWDSTTSGTYYLGFEVNFGTIAGSADGNMGHRAVELWGSAFGDDSHRTNIGYSQFSSTLGAAQQNAATARMQLNIAGVSQQIIGGSPESYNSDGLTHLVVLKCQLTASPLGDSISLYLDPTGATEPSLPNAAVWGIDFTLQAIGAISSFGGGTGGAFDELRVGTAFVDSVPPPADPGPCAQLDHGCYLAVFQHLNLTGQSLATGDLTGDGKVNIADYRAWKDHRTDIAGAGAFAAQGVPEPSSLILAVATAAFVATLPRLGRRFCAQPVPRR